MCMKFSVDKVWNVVGKIKVRSDLPFSCSLTARSCSGNSEYFLLLPVDVRSRETYMQTRKLRGYLL
jgi:hypothetical protein